MQAFDHQIAVAGGADIGHDLFSTDDSAFERGIGARFEGDDVTGANVGVVPGEVVAIGLAFAAGSADIDEQAVGAVADADAGAAA